MYTTEISAASAIPALPSRFEESQQCSTAMPVAQPDLVEDLRTLLRSVATALDVISAEPSVGESSRLHLVTATARRSVEHASALVGHAADDEEDGGRAESIDIARCVIDLAPALHAACGSDIVLELAGCRGSAPLWCRRLEFENVVLNLVVNARDAMPGGGVLSIATGSNGSASYIRVADTGIGMSPDVRAHALEPFFTTKRDRGGSGVGLAMVAKFVNAIGGEVCIESAPGAGTTIVVTGPGAPRP